MKARSLSSFTIKKEDLVRHFAKAKVRSFKKGERIVVEGEASNSFFFLHQGKVAVSKKVRGQRGPGLALGTLAPGNFLGEMATLSGAKRSATATALTAVETVEISRSEFEARVRAADALAGQIALEFAVQLAARSSRILALLARNGAMLTRAQSKPVDVRQVLHKVYSFWAV